VKRDVSIYFDIITSLKTTGEVESFVSEIDALMLKFFESEEVSMVKVLDSISEDSSLKIRQVFARNNLNFNNRDTVSKFFKTLKEIIKKLKVIKIVLAFDPSVKTIENIHNFITDLLGIGYILEIEVFQEILAGAIVIFNGKYVDFCLKKRIEDTFREKADQIVSAIG
jgi:F0F1-type ATP synthase delta subunit